VRGLLAVAGAHKAMTAVVAAAVVAGGVGVDVATDDTTTATVAKVVDGDTIDVRYDGELHRVRLLNVNTPESVDPDKPVECLGPEASTYLATQLPLGTSVRLRHDHERLDGYGRELAAVYVGDTLINAEIARAGFGVAMSIGPNTSFLAPVQLAQAEARTAARGLYSTSLGCTIPAQITALEQAATTAVSRAPASTAELAAFDSAAVELAAVVATGRALAAVLEGAADVFPLLAHTPAEIARMQRTVRDALDAVARAQASNESARAAQRRRLDEAARKAAEEAARTAAEAAARKAADDAARRAAEEAAAAAAARPAPRQTSSTTRSPSGSSRTSNSSRTTTPAPKSGSPSTGGPSGYTGCRSYAPGGKTWTPIDC
jgi:micrococcal nuclease